MGFLKLVEVALELGEGAFADGVLGVFEKGFFGVGGEPGVVDEDFEKLLCFALARADLVVDDLVADGFALQGLLVVVEGGIDLGVVLLRERDGLLPFAGAEDAGGFDEGEFFDFGVGGDLVEAVAALVADEGEGGAGVVGLRAPAAGAEGEVADLAEAFGVFGAELAQLHEQGEGFVALFFEVFVEQAEGVGLFFGGVDLAVFAEGGVEGLELDEGFFLQLDLGVDFGGGEEVVDVNFGGGGADAVDATDALHEAGGVPGGVVVEDDVGAVEIDAFGEDFGGDEDVVVVGLFGGGDVGVEVGADSGHQVAAGRGVDGEDFVEAFVGEAAGEVVGGVFGLGKNDELGEGAGGGGVVDAGGEEFVAEAGEEFVELGVVVDLAPAGAEVVEDGEVALEAGEEAGVEVFGGADFDAGVVLAEFDEEFEQFVLATLDDEFGDVDVGGDEDGAVGEHLDHGAGGVAEAAEGFFEGVEGGVDALEKEGAHDAGELGGDLSGVLKAGAFLGDEVADGAVAVVGEAGVELGEGLVVEGVGGGQELVEDLARWIDGGEADALGVEVVLVVRVGAEVGAGAAHGDLGDDLGADPFVDALDLGAGFAGHEVFEGFLELLLPVGEEALQVGHFEGGVLAVLEEQEEVADVERAVVERGGGNEDNALAEVGAVGETAVGAGLADALQFVVGGGGVVAELVGFVDDDEVVLFGVADFVEAAVGDDPDALETELVDGVAPAFLQCGRDDDEGLGEVDGEAVVVEEFLGDEDGDDGLA